MSYYLFGAFCGFSYFVYQTTTVGSIYNRPDEHGENRFSIKGIVPYLASPFTQNPVYVENLSDIKSMSRDEILARADMLKLNWVFTTGVGAAVIGTTLSVFF